jgi:hypothetical protein
MTRLKQVFYAILLTLFSGSAIAQNNTNSPYSRYGFGQISDPSFGNSKAMGGIAYGLRDGSLINASNPASYTAIDSLTFLFDGGLTLQNTNFSDGKLKMNAKNSSFDYIAMQFRLSRRLAMSAGFLPISYVGYNVSSTANAAAENASVQTYFGEGGLHRAYVGAGFKLLERLSVGANVSYVFGTISHTASTTFPNDNTVYSNSVLDQVSVRDYSLDFGLQYTHKIGAKKKLTLGVVFAPERKLNNDAYVQTTISSVVRRDTVASFGLPSSFGAGLAYVYDNRLTVGFDYSLQKWSDVAYMSNSNYYNDRSKYSLGMEYIPSLVKRNYFSRVKYRLGVYYSQPYYKIGNEGFKEYGVSGGFALPVFSSKSLLSISAQYVKVTPKSKMMLDENYLKLSIGLTFNERWFMKWKVE